MNVDAVRSVSSAPVPRRAHNYLAGVLTGYVVVGLTVAVNFWLTPFTLRFLDREEYALFVFGNDLLTWLVVLDLGMTMGLRAQVAQLTGRPDRGRMNRLASTTFFAQLAVACLMLIAGGALSALTPRLFHIRADLQGQASLVLLLLTLGFALNFATQAFASLLYAHQQVHYDNMIRVAQLLARVAVTVLLLLSGWKVLALAVASLVSVALFALLAVVRAYLTVPGLSISWRLASSALMWRDLKELHLWYAASSLAGIALQSLDRLVATRLIALASVTTLTLTGRVYALAVLLLTPLTAAAQPAVGQLLGAGKRAEAFDAYRQLCLLSLGATLIAALALWSGNAAFVTRWVGAENYGGATLDSLMMLNLILFSWSMPHRMALIGALRARPQALTRGAEALLSLGLSVWLAPRYGLPGIAAAMIVAAALTSCWQLPRLVADYFGRSSWEVLRATGAPLILPLCLLAPIAVGLRLFVAARGGYLNALAAMVAVGVCGCMLLWWFGLKAEMGARALSALRDLARLPARVR
jgi:O-antigen/teichoic acid export membrane protein